MRVFPEKENYEPGDVLIFSAIGNPTPTLTLKPEGEVNADGSISVTVTEEMLNQEFHYTFKAGTLSFNKHEMYLPFPD